MNVSSPTMSRSGFGDKNAAKAPSADLGRLFDRQPPHSVENECALLGAMILDWRVSGDVLQIIQGPEDFYLEKNGHVYRVLVEMYDKVQVIELPQLKQKLQDLGLLEGIGGVEYLIELAESVPSAVSAEHYARIVREKAILRRLIDAAGRILATAYTTADPVTTQLDVAEQEIFKLAETGASEEASGLGELLHELHDQIAARVDEGRVITGIETGYYELDEMTSGLQKGEMIIIAARPSMGKTALALNIAEHIALNQRQAVAIFSLEMSRQQLAQRLLCSLSGVDSHKLRRNMLNPDDFNDLQKTIGGLADAPMFIDDTPGLTPLTMRAKARRLASQHDIQAVIVDYLQLMTSHGSESRQQEVSTISREIKALARELSVPVICLSQLNRSPEAREGHKPRMSDLRESGSIEQDADVVMMLHREDYYHRGEEDYTENHQAELIITKQRNGPTGTVKLQFHGPTTRFNNLAAGQAAASY